MSSLWAGRQAGSAWGSARCPSSPSRFEISSPNWMSLQNVMPTQIFGGIRRTRQRVESKLAWLLPNHPQCLLKQEGFEGTHLLRGFVQWQSGRTAMQSVWARACSGESGMGLSLVVPFFRLVRFLTQRGIKAQGGPANYQQDISTLSDVWTIYGVNPWQVIFSRTINQIDFVTLKMFQN